MRLVNLTPHAIVLRLGETDYTVPPSGTVARVKSVPGASGTLEIETGAVCPFASAPTWGEVEGLPSPTDGVAYLVSGLVLGRLQGRPDVFGPGTGPSDSPVRDADGKIIAVTRLVQAG